MLCEGDYVDNNGDLQKNKSVTVWGEWEADSDSVNWEAGDYSANIKNIGKRFPKYLFKPYIRKEIPPKAESGENGKSTCSIDIEESKACCSDNGGYQNTDPFIFGDNFLYGICKQGPKKGFKKNKLTELEVGSVILFGNRIGKRKGEFKFEIDTVFVVGDYFVDNDHKYYYTDEVEKLLDYPQVNSDYVKMSLMLAYPKGCKREKRRLYFGATYDNPVNGMYSFSPVREYDGKGFEKLLIDSEEETGVSLGLNRNWKKLKKDPQGVWETVRKKSRRQGYFEGVRFEMPRREQ